MPEAGSLEWRGAGRETAGASPTLRGLVTSLIYGSTLLAACGAGDGSSLDDGGRMSAHPYAPSLGSKYGAVNFPSTFSGVSQVFFVKFCTGCHAGSSPAKGLDLSPKAAFDALVRVPSSQRSGLYLVDPGAPAESYLLRKLAGGPNTVGRRMPRGRPARPQEELDLIETWIQNGAKRD